MLDAGAVAAVTHRRKSLLPAGITGVGRRVRRRRSRRRVRTRRHGDRARHSQLRGIELPRLLGKSTRDLARDLGPAYEREVIHRDDLVVL